MREAARLAVANFDEPRPADPLKTGFLDLDEVTGGLCAGDLWVVLGRSGVGKSVLARDLLRAAMRQRKGCLHLARHHAPEQVATWTLAAEGRVPLHRLATGRATEAEQARLRDAAVAFADAPAVLARWHGSVDGGLLGRIDDFDRSRDTPCELVILDDLSHGDDQMKCVRAAREVAASRPVAVVVVVQDDFDEPKLQSHRLEQVAHVVLRLHRDDQDDGDCGRAGEADLRVVRNRRGPVATITLAFQGHYGRFVSLP